MVKPRSAPFAKTTLLKRYKAKRNFNQSPEPTDESTPPKKTKNTKQRLFVIHKHAASRLHYDLRLECEGVLCSWAIPRGPSMDPLVNRLSVRVEDHPLSYHTLETVIPPGNYGAGTMMVWDGGNFKLYETLPGETHDQAFLRQYRKGSLKIELNGQKVRGRFTLVKIKKSAQDEWLLVKKRDQYATSSDILLSDRSILSGLSIEEIAAAKKVPTKAKHVKETKARKSSAPAAIARQLGGLTKSTPSVKFKVMRPKKSLTTQIIQDGRLLQYPPAGMIAVAIITKDSVEMRSTVGLNLTSRLRDACELLRKLPDDTALLGIAVLGKPAQFHIFDVLWFGGHAVHEHPLAKRWQLLQDLKFDAPIYRIDAVTDIASHSGIVWSRNLQAPFTFDACTDDWTESTLRGRGDASKGAPVRITKAPLTNPNKLFWPTEKITKQDLYNYYKEIADVILPYLKDRPESLHRHPDGFSGKSFFQKDVAGSVPGWVSTTHLPAYGGTKTVTYLLCQDVDTLLYMINMGCIELNPWLSRVPSITKPDFAVIDIDPGTRPFSDVIKGAQIVRGLFEKLGVESFCKTSGGRGIHIFVPTDGTVEFSECQSFAESVGSYLCKKLPAISSTESSPLVRRDKLYIDALQNRKGQTMASVYAVRPRPGAPVSTPIAWNELTKNLDPLEFTLKTIRTRLEKKGDLWAPLLKCGNNIRKLNKELAKLLGESS